MSGHHDGDAELALELDEQVEDDASGGGVEVASGFVGEDEVGAVDDGAGERDALLLAAGEFIRVAVGLVGNAQCARSRSISGATLAGEGAVEHERDRDIIEDAQAGEEVERLKDEAEAAAAEEGEIAIGHAGKIAAADGDRAGGGAINGAEQIEERAFARAAGPRSATMRPRGIEREIWWRAVKALSPWP